jgi:hypothetical protein
MYKVEVTVQRHVLIALPNRKSSQLPILETVRWALERNGLLTEGLENLFMPGIEQESSNIYPDA